jgi:peptidoglycan hydrolase-like protein with peptidoglycan-binding domain
MVEDDSDGLVGDPVPSAGAVSSVSWFKRWWRRLLLPAVGLLVVGLVVAVLAPGPSPSTGSLGLPRTLLTEKVDKRVLLARVITRGSVETVGDTQVGCYPSSAASEVKVFTRPPKTGASLAEGEVLAGVNGRPVLALKGKTAAFRDILPGSTGLDVEQLQAGLRRLGYQVSDKKGVFGKTTQAAVRKWYTGKGYPAQGPTPAEAAALRSSSEAIEQAQSTVWAANDALKKARKGPSRSGLLSAELSVYTAQQEVAKATGAELVLAKKQLAIAKESLRELKKPDLASYKTAVAEAGKALKRARREAAVSSKTIGVTIPYCEVVFLPSMPVTVSSVPSPGSDSGAGNSEKSKNLGWVSVSTGGLLLRSTVNSADAGMITEGAAARFRSDNDVSEHSGKVSLIETDRSGQTSLTITPDTPFTEEQRGLGFRVSIDVGATAGEVLVVPIAAVAGTADGLARVEKMVGEQRVPVKIQAGLSADGFVEVLPVAPDTLNAGDDVVVGRWSATDRATRSDP